MATTTPRMSTSLNVARLAATNWAASRPSPASMSSTGPNTTTAAMGSATAYIVVIAISTIMALSEGTPSQSTCSGPGGTPIAGGGAKPGAIGRPHCGQWAADVET